MRFINWWRRQFWLAPIRGLLRPLEVIVVRVWMKKVLKESRD